MTSPGVAASLAALSATSVSASPYGGELQGFDYPHPRQTHALASQGQALSMAYMDVRPTGAGNGRTAVLLHGKNFCAATWEDTIRVLVEPVGAGSRLTW